jgi:Lipase
MHLIGFSLGAQVQAVASRNVQQRSGRRHIVGRLTGLDPGQVPSVWIPFVGRLGSADAQFVDSIHTEAVGFGEHESAGHVQFMVNGGVAQPFCNQAIQVNAQTCSHNFAVFAWNEAVRARAARFPALPCANWDQFLAGGCNSNTPVGNMGPITQLNLRGRYFLRTNLQAPWSRNVATP